MDIEQSLIRNESFNDNEIRFFSETDDVVTAISSLYDQDQDQVEVVDDSSNETNEVVDADSNNVYSANEFPFGPKRPRQLQLHNHGHMDAHVQILHHVCNLLVLFLFFFFQFSILNMI